MGSLHQCPQSEAQVEDGRETEAASRSGQRCSTTHESETKT